MTVHRIFNLIAVLLIAPNAMAQGEANNWYFGDEAGITFNSGIPQALTDGALFTLEGCSTISDNLGNLLFYSDGISVWDKNHNVMPNGSDLLGHPSSTQSGIIVPHPGNSDLFYVFSVDYLGGSNGLTYSVVDITLNSGFGDVTSEKNILLQTPSTEKITAIKHANGNDIWVLTHKLYSNEFYNYLITDSGLNTTPVITSVGHIPSDVVDSVGYMKFSPDGTKLALAHFVSNLVELYEFDTATGIMANPIQISDENLVMYYGLEFSPNNQVLYASTNENRIYQYDISSSDANAIRDSKTLVNPAEGPNLDEPRRSLQLGPDSKIYISNYEEEYLSSIDNPNGLGASCNYVLNSVSLNGKQSLIGLPPFIQSYFYVGFEAEYFCEDDSTQFTANISQSYDSLIWDFGDGNTSNEENPTHTYSNAGDYEVSLSVTSGTNSSLDTKTITILENPIVNMSVTISQCDDDLDGFSNYNLTEVNSEISANHQNETITYYETELEAAEGNSPISDYINYANQTAGTDTIWARVENSFGCYAISQVNLTVSTTQIPDTFTRSFYQCDSGANTTDGIATFDFSSVIADVEALFPVGQQLIINFYESVTDALSETNSITNASNYQNSNSPYVQQIYIRVDSALNNDCLGLGLHITLHVEAVPIVNTVTFPVACDVDGDGSFAFDTTTLENDLRNGQTDITISYTDENGAVLPSPLPNPFETSSQTITVRLTNANSQNPSGACYTESAIGFVVQDEAIAHPINDIMACDENGDGIFAFDTTDLEVNLLNGQTGMIVSYFDESSNALSSPLPNPFNSSTQTITARVENALTANCFDETTINFIVSEQPVANAVMDHFVCNNLANNAQYTFNLSDYDSEVLSGQSNVIYEISYFNTQTDAESNQNPLPNFYEVSADVVNVFARIQNRSNTDCYDITSFQLGLSYLPIANQPNDLGVCDDSSNDGMENFNLGEQNENILNGLPEADYNITYHLSQSDAEASSMSLNLSYTNIENPQTVFARLENASNPSCFTVSSFALLVYETPVLVMEDEMAICDGSSVQLTADFGYDYYNWSTGQTTRAITVYEPGVYTVNVSNTFGDLVCSTEKTILVEESDSAVITEIATIDWSQDDNVIEVYVDGIGDYEYSIDNFNYQNSNVFSDLSVGEYTIYVRDKNGCGMVSEELYLLYYPKYFTPNGDGVRDVWQVINAFEEPNNRLSIYDRYGKLIKTLKPNDFGWDGMYNGNKMPSSDYWFVLERENGKTYNGHFSLKR